MIITLDPGHGGKDPGAVGKIAREKDLNFSLCKKLKSILEQDKRIKCFMTRTNDIFVPLHVRAEISNKRNSDLFISIHTNASLNKEACGIEIYTSRGCGLSDKIALSIKSNLVFAKGNRNQMIKEMNFDVLRLTKAPAILIECGFITNPEEEKKLNDPVYQEKIYQGIYEGLKPFIK